MGAGFTSGCCNAQVSSNCHGSPPDCWCDAECYDYGNCCQDIHSIGCFEAPGSCLSAGYTSCCLAEQDTCLGKPANCFCDQLCTIHDNCCGDIDQLSNCDLPTGPTNLGGWKGTHILYNTQALYGMSVCMFTELECSPPLLHQLSGDREVYIHHDHCMCKGCTGT